MRIVVTPTAKKNKSMRTPPKPLTRPQKRVFETNNWGPVEASSKLEQKHEFTKDCASTTRSMKSANKVHSCGNYEEETIINGPTMRIEYYLQGTCDIDGVIYHCKESFFDGRKHECIKSYLVLDGPSETEDMSEKIIEDMTTMRKSFRDKDGTQHVDIYLRQLKWSGRLVLEEKNERVIESNDNLIVKNERLIMKVIDNKDGSTSQPNLYQRACKKYGEKGDYQGDNKNKFDFKSGQVVRVFHPNNGKCGRVQCD